MISLPRFACTSKRSYSREVRNILSFLILSNLFVRLLGHLPIVWKCMDRVTSLSFTRNQLITLQRTMHIRFIVSSDVLPITAALIYRLLSVSLVVVRLFWKQAQIMLRKFWCSVPGQENVKCPNRNLRWQLCSSLQIPMKTFRRVRKRTVSY